MTGFNETEYLDINGNKVLVRVIGIRMELVYKYKVLSRWIHTEEKQKYLEELLSKHFQHNAWRSEDGDLDDRISIEKEPWKLNSR